MSQESMKIKKPTFPANKLATTVGANGLRSEIVVSQPRIQIPVVEEVEYEFDQKKFEDYLSSSSSRSSSPRRSKKISAAKRVRWSSDAEPQGKNSDPAPVSVAGSGISPASKKAGSADFNSSMQEFSIDGAPALSKRARQRRRQSLARQFAKAMESADGVCCKADLKSNRGKKPQNQTVGSSSKMQANDWVRVKRNRSTLQERIMKRRALLVHARALVEEARALKLLNARPSQRPKPGSTVKAKVEVLKKDQPSRGVPTSSPPPHPKMVSKSSTITPPSVDPVGSSRRKRTVLERLSPLPSDQGKVPAKELLGLLRKSRVTPNAGGRTHLNHNKKAHTTAYTSLRIQAQEPDEDSQSQRRTSRRVTYDGPKKAVRPRMETFSSDDENVIPEKSYQHTMGCSGIHADELYYRAGGTSRSRKRRSPERNVHCPCSRLIKAVLAECDCNKATPNRLSVFDRLSAKTPELKSRRSRIRRLAFQDGELPNVSINMTSKGTSSRGIPAASQRVTRLRSGTIRRPNHGKAPRGLPSEDEMSDASSAFASEETASSEGRSRETLMISSDQMAKILEEALAKQKENFQLEMQMAMQEMRDFQEKQLLTLLNRQGELSRRDANQTDSDTDREEDRNVDTPGGGVNLQKADGNTVLPPPNPSSESLSENEKLKDLESKINSMLSAQEVKKTGIPCPYPREWESIPYPAKFNLINFTPFDGKGSPTQHLIYFKSHLGVISGNEPLMVRSFVGTLRGAAFDWYRRLKSGSVSSWGDMETMFLSNFFDDDTEISIGTLLDEKQKDGELIDTFIKRFRNKAMNCRDPITEEFILQTCHNNLSLNVLKAMGTAPSPTWKDLKVRGEQAERFLKRKKAERGQQMANAHEQNFVSRSKGKMQANAVDVNQTLQLQQQAPRQSQPQQRQQPQRQRSSEPRFTKVYSFKDDEVPGIFKHLLENNKIQLPPIVNQEEADQVTDPRYCAYHRAVHHPTKSCYHLKDKIQALIDVGVITPKHSREKKLGVAQ